MVYSATDLENIAVSDLRVSLSSLGQPKDDECSICLTEKIDTALPECGHAFCSGCLK